MRLRTAFLSVLLATAAVSALAGEGGVNGLPLPKGKPRRPMGMPALQVQAGTLDLSKEALAAYVKEHNLPRNLGQPGDISVRSVETVSIGLLRQRYGVPATGFADSEEVAVVTFGGSLVFQGPSGSTPARFSSAYAVFDTTTGNLLMLGTLAP